MGLAPKSLKSCSVSEAKEDMEVPDTLCLPSSSRGHEILYSQAHTTNNELPKEAVGDC